jgi:hypothetical protein
MGEVRQSESDLNEFDQAQNAESYAATQVPSDEDVNREETPGQRRRIVALEARVSPDSYGVYPESALMFFGSCANESTRASGAFNVRFEVDGSPYGAEIPVGSLDPGAYHEVNLQVIPGTLSPGMHIMAVICNTDFVIEKPDPLANRLGAFMFRVSEPDGS